MKGLFLSFIIASASCLFPCTLFSQQGESASFVRTQTFETDSIYDHRGIHVPQAWEQNLDELQHSWYVKNFTEKHEHSGYLDSEPISDAVIMDRLSKLHCVIELPYNDIVRSCIDRYTNRLRKSVETMLGLEKIYFPMIEQALDENNLPLELKYLAVVESALNPVAVSRAGATGLWQFMLETGREYGLEINSIVDERRDPYKATYAACEYFKRMYAIYGDWTLVIAAYNCGAGNVNKAIKRANGATDYWAIYPYLPKETRTYVPLFIAATYTMNYYAHHKLYPVKTTLPIATDTVMVTKEVHFNQITDLIDVDIETLRGLNPQYKQDIIPGHVTPRILKLPTLQTYAYIHYEDSIPNHRRGDFFQNRDIAGDYSGGNKITHKVASGETLPDIASRYGVSLSNLRKWNGLKSNSVKAGRSLTVYPNNGGYAYGSGGSSSKSTSSSSKSKSSASTSNKKSSSSKGSYGTYTVRKGDTLSTIAQRHKCSYKQLMKINNMKNTKLRIGQRLKVPKK
jgi:FOG: LysM repeat